MAKTAYELYTPVVSAVRELLEKGGCQVVGIDGRCGSGKTSLGRLLGQKFGCNVFHMDDFYLPFSRREQGWEEQVAGNMDLERFLHEVLLPAQNGLPVTYRRFDCRSGELLDEEVLQPTSLTVVEGSYSNHPLLRDVYRLRVFLTCAPQEQERRLREREGDNFQSFVDRWIPMEERYFMACGVMQGASLVLDTTELSV